MATVYILYNADGTVMGKLRYGYRKLTGPKEPACAACDITHGKTLSLSESPDWLKAKAEMEGTGVKVTQLHRDQLTLELKAFIDRESVRFPTVILKTEDGRLEEVLARPELAECDGQPLQLMKRLRDKGKL